MKEYIFILGRNPELSMLELTSYLEARNVKHKVETWKGSAAIISMEPQNFKKTIKQLGGTVKIAEVIKDLDKATLYTGKSSKLKYAISAYDSTNTAELQAYIKQRLKQERIKATQKKSKRKDPFLEPMELHKQNILNQGFELTVFNGEVGKTIAAYNPLEYKERDTKAGISIRLAKILVNLAGTKGSIQDPEGKGTITREAKLMGHKTSPRASSISTAPRMTDAPAAKQRQRYEKMLRNPRLKTIVVAVPRVRRHKQLELRALAKTHNFIPYETKQIKLPITYKAKNSRIERDIWVLKRKL